MSFWATIISFIQMMIFDRTELMNLAKTDHPGPVAGWLICFSFCLFIVYSLMPIAFNISSAVFVNLGLLTGISSRIKSEASQKDIKLPWVKRIGAPGNFISFCDALDLILHQ